MWRSLAPPPKSINACYDKNGKMDSSRFRLFQRSNRIKFARHYSRMMERTSEEEVEEKAPSAPKKRRAKNLVMQYRDDDGCLSNITPRTSVWHLTYITNPARTQQFDKSFRRRFRMPYESFLSYHEDAVNNLWFPR